MCRTAAVRSVEDMSRPALSRPRTGKVIGGVCAGIARTLGVSPTLVRVLALVSILLPGPQVIAYVILWIVLPRDPA